MTLSSTQILRHPPIGLSVAIMALAAATADRSAGAPPNATLSVAKSPATLHIAVPTKLGAGTNSAGFQLVESRDATKPLPAQLAPGIGDDGLPSAESRRVLAVVQPGQSGSSARRFTLRPSRQDGKSPFSFRNTSPTTLRLMENQLPVLAYNFGTIVGEHVPADDARRARSCYVHPIWGMSGEILTADFPKDHYHHHGLFWTWPHVLIEGKEYDLWADRGGIRQKFIRWLHRETGPVAAILAFENGWFIGERQVMTERVWLTVYRSDEQSRTFDISLTWIPIDNPIALRGAPNKSYGGLTLRFAPQSRQATTITVPSGPTTADLPDTPLPWADFTSTFDKPGLTSGAALFVHPQHPSFPPTWLTRHYGPLCVGWPGVKAQTFPAGKPFQLDYRIWIHKAAATTEELGRVYDAYTASTKAASAPVAAEPASD